MSQPGQWQVASSAPEVYERELVPAVFGEWAPTVVELAHPRPGERLVDVACGTGIVARIAAARVDRQSTMNRSHAESIAFVKPHGAVERFET